MSGHLVYKQKVTLHLSRRDEATAFQERVSKLLRNELNDSLERILDNAFPTDKIIRIDSLQVDLGTINAQSFESEFKKQFVDIVTKSLASKRDSINSSGSTTGEETVLSKAQSLENALIFFLERGYLPWYSTAGNRADWEKEILNNFSDHDQQHFLNWVKDNYPDNPVIIERLILQFSDKFIAELLSKTNTAFADPWESVFADYGVIVNGFEDNTASPLCFAFSPSAVRAKIWQYALPVLLNTKDSDPALHILKALSAFLGISSKSIYDKKENDISKGLRTNTVKLAFQRLAAFLKQGEANRDDMENSTSPGKRTVKNKPGEADTEDVSSSAKTQRKNNNRDTDGENSEAISAQNGDAYVAGAANKPASSSVKRKYAKERDVINVDNSGVVILHPFLKRYFEGLGLAANGEFMNDEVTCRAVLLLNYLVTGEEEASEFDLTLPKILCGLPLEKTLAASIKITDNERTESHDLLNSVIDHWEPLKNTSIKGFRSTFLQRNGSLELKENGWLLTVEQKTLDILLGKLPWGFSTIRLPWMKDVLSVDWY